MKNASIVLALLAMSALTSTAAVAGDTNHTDFVVKLAHDANFRGCDQAIRSTFKGASGDNARVESSFLKQTRSDELQLTVLYGDEGDNVLEVANIRRVGTECLVKDTGITTTAHVCTAFLAANPVWQYIAGTNDAIFSQNKGGVTLWLVPVGSNCQLTYQSSHIYSAG
jgi:hypothetical protein